LPICARVVADANTIDPLLDLPGAYQVLLSVVDSSQLEVLFTHICGQAWGWLAHTFDH